MAYETCPQCGAEKHQLVACPKCGFKRMTTRPPLDRELLDSEEFPRPRSTSATLVSSNFEFCPTCETRKHLLMACPECGFTRSGNPERIAHKPATEPKPRREYTPRRENAPRRDNNPRREHTPSSPSYPNYPNYNDDSVGNYQVERPSSPQAAPVVRWKRSKVPDKGNS